MTPNKKDKTQKILRDYTTSAEFYNSRYESIQIVKYSLLLPKLISNSDKFLFNSPFLDYGGGTGLLLKFFSGIYNYLDNISLVQQNLHEIFKDEEIIHFERFLKYLMTKKTEQIGNYLFPSILLCDLSRKMLIECKNYIRNSNLTMLQGKFCGLVECNGENLPFREKSFSTITAFTVLQNLNTIRRGLEEIARISKDKSAIGITIFKKWGDKMKFIELLKPFFKGIRSVFVNDDLIEDFFSVIKNLENKNIALFDTQIVKDIKKTEDYFFYILKN